MTSSSPLQILLAVLVLTPVLVSSSLTIPRRSLGHVYIKSNASRSSLVTLTAFVDFTCDESQKAFPTIIKVADMLAGKNFELLLESFSLPFHRNSHTINEMVHVIDERKGSTAVFVFLTEIYKNLDHLTTAATRDKTDYQVLDILLPIVFETTNIPKDVMQKAIAERRIDLAARLDFQYGCTRTVHGTPTFMVNDVFVDATPTWTVDQWMNLIKPLL